MITKKYKELYGIKIFNKNIQNNHRDYNAKGLEILFKNEEKHFWFITRKEFILKKVNKYLRKNDKIIEIGAGTGNIARYLRENGFINICVGEMHLNGLLFAKSYGIEECYQFDLLDSPFEKEFDAVCMFDVLEHISDDYSALLNVYKMLRDKGKIILTVPAHMWLWSRYDAIACHKIRYSKKQLTKKLKDTGFKVIETKYFFSSILPLLILREFLHKDNRNPVKQEEYDIYLYINPIVNKILLKIVRIENSIHNFLPNLVGGSLLAIAEKKS